MITTPGVTKPQPVKCSDPVTRALARAAAAGVRRRRTDAEGAATLLVRVGEDLVHLLRGAVQRRRWLALAEQNRDDHVAQDLGDLRVGGYLRASLADVVQVADERIHARQGLVHPGQEARRVL